MTIWYELPTMIFLLLDPAPKKPINPLLTPTLKMMTMTLQMMIIVPLLLMVMVMVMVRK
jgi:hypothetical protein